MDLREKVRRRSRCPIKEVVKSWAKSAGVDEAQAIYHLEVFIRDGTLPCYLPSNRQLDGQSAAWGLCAIAEWMLAGNIGDWNPSDDFVLEESVKKSIGQLSVSVVYAIDFNKILKQLGVDSFPAWPGLLPENENVDETDNRVESLKGEEAERPFDPLREEQLEEILDTALALSIDLKVPGGRKRGDRQIIQGKCLLPEAAFNRAWQYGLDRKVIWQKKSTA